MSTTGKTSTFTIHHDICDPSKWTPHDVLKLHDFIRTGSLQYAAALARIGVQLVLSEHHEPRGGTLEPFGWIEEDFPDEGYFFADIEEMLSACDDDDVTAVRRVYRGPIEYAVRLSIGDGDGDIEGYEIETRASEADARALLERDDETIAQISKEPIT